MTATFRWLLFAMWVCAFCGMAFFGMKEEHTLAANQFHLLFVPLFICYGMAFILVQWDRRIRRETVSSKRDDPGGSHSQLRTFLVAGIFVVSGIPVLGSILLDRSRPTVEWPPYVPPSIATFRNWITPDEIIGSDVPWAVAWYADRRSLWLPFDRTDLFTLSKSKDLEGRLSGFISPPSVARRISWVTCGMANTEAGAGISSEPSIPPTLPSRS